MKRVAASLPKISIITPCFNAAATIERTLQSIVQQSYPNIELIIVDGLSTDGTLEIVGNYGDIVSRIICEKDNGVAQALNKGFRLATGDIFCYLNADDCFYHGALHRIAEEFASSPHYDVVTGGCLRVFADGSSVITHVPGDFEQVISLRNDLEQPSTFWRASAHQSAAEFDESYALAFDWEWWNRLHRRGAKFKIVEDVVSVYHFSDHNLTSRGGMRVIDEMYRVTKTYGPYGGYIADVYRFLFRCFDMQGYYDGPLDALGFWKQRYFFLTLSALYMVFDRRVINSYNWNWASKQVRGVCWYR
jgi:glycosyltransferase involved in cell wall biosynthesis